ncbi:hypothetical protein, partial [Bacillus anthracis]|uniref:hypothetical protein n=1 Tax=Bacillus anthracis TaxID=1392 RepID=UPI001E3C70C0
ESRKYEKFIGKIFYNMKKVILCGNSKKLIKLKIPYLGFVLYIVMCNIYIRDTSKIKMISNSD